MRKPFQRLFEIKGFRNNYLTLVISTVLLFISFVASGQSVDTIHGNFDYSGINKIYGDFVLTHSDTMDKPQFAGTLRYKASDKTLYKWDGFYFSPIAGAGVITNPDGTQIVVSYVGGVLCFKYPNDSTVCYDYSNVLSAISNGADRAKLYSYNLNGGLKDSANLFVSVLYGRNGITATQGGGDSIFVNGTLSDSIVSFALNGSSDSLILTLRDGRRFAVKIATGAASVSKFYQSLTATGGQTTFSFTTVPAASNGYTIYINGAAISKSYYSVSGNDIIFSTGLSPGDVVELQGIQ